VRLVEDREREARALAAAALRGNGAQVPWAAAREVHTRPAGVDAELAGRPAVVGAEHLVQRGPRVVGLVEAHRGNLDDRPVDRHAHGLAVVVPAAEAHGPRELGERHGGEQRALAPALRHLEAGAAVREVARDRVEPVEGEDDPGLLVGQDELAAVVGRAGQVRGHPLEHAPAEGRVLAPAAPPLDALGERHEATSRRCA
jgi:hypothetical protein